MKRFILISALAAWLCAPAWAKNGITTVSQVSQAVTLDTDVDYHITGSEPFTSTGSINIVNTDHAVVIMDALRPTLAKAYLSFIKINGAEAKDGTNCQLRLYNRGAILLPYGGSTFRPLTVFDGKDFTGNSYNQLTEGHNGSGFMKDLPTAWNNKIRSFKLKRGYMVTFALGNTGQGYSRCFIAADEDLQVTLPNLMDRRITSYRLFKWYDAGKAQIADCTDMNIIRAVKGTSVYAWAIGGDTSTLPDAEFLISRYKNENGWPSPSNVGSAPEGSPHLKNDNEPLNPADECYYSSYDAALHGTIDSWGEYMRTGRRMLTPSSWDGVNGEALLHALLDTCDARGWRCDVIDMHCYWTEGSFDNLAAWVNRHHRPIWITEWVWGASWNHNGAFSGGVSQATNRDAVKRICDKLNNWKYIERYYYWNHEQWQSKIYDGGLTTTGEYYASMETPMAYNGSVNYIPTAPRTYRPHKFSLNFMPSTMKVRVAWTLRNGELADSVEILRADGVGRNNKFVKIQGYSASDVANRTSMTYNDQLETNGTYRYKIKEIDAAGRTLETDEEILIIGGTEKGLPDFQYGTITLTPGEQVNLFFADAFDVEPVLLPGSITYKNTGTGSSVKGMVSTFVKSGKIGTEYKYAVYQEKLWDNVTATAQETVNYIVGKPGNGTIGNLHYEMGYAPLVEGESGFTNADDISFSNAVKISSRDQVIREVKFRQPFTSTPVVMACPRTGVANAVATMWRVWDVTNEGFKVVLTRQAGNTITTELKVPVAYLAIEQGVGRDGLGNLYEVSTQEKLFKLTSGLADGGDCTFETELTHPSGEGNPLVMAQLQTNDQYKSYSEAIVGSILRIDGTTGTSAKMRLQVDRSNSDYFLNVKPVTETIGFIRIAADPDYDGIKDYGKDSSVEHPGIYTLTGIRLDRPTQSGVYIVNGKKVLLK